VRSRTTKLNAAAATTIAASAVDIENTATSRRLMVHPFYRAEHETSALAATTTVYSFPSAACRRWTFVSERSHELAAIDVCPEASPDT
jgi:hypothetical protein